LGDIVAKGNMKFEGSGTDSHFVQADDRLPFNADDAAKANELLGQLMNKVPDADTYVLPPDQQPPPPITGGKQVVETTHGPM